MVRHISDDQIVFTTVHGSRLYGLEHKDSDHDLFVVVDDGLYDVKHYQDDESDVVVASLPKFLEYAASGSHQSVEALFSPYKEWGGAAAHWRAFIDAMRVTGGDVVEKYERTIRKFCYGDFKRRRHAVRLYFNLAQIRAYGRCYPAMSREEIDEANTIAQTHSGDRLAERLRVWKEREE